MADAFPRRGHTLPAELPGLALLPRSGLA
jgi:hypothetical protein